MHGVEPGMGGVGWNQVCAGWGRTRDAWGEGRSTNEWCGMQTGVDELRQTDNQETESKKCTVNTISDAPTADMVVCVEWQGRAEFAGH